MAAASQQASSSASYGVFLSFHGKDVRIGFADHLYHALVGAGIRTFRDDEELSKGEEIATNLLVAIQQSKISIPILSMNYGSSKWCLNELKEISKCKRTRNQTILPVFYRIEPTDVRNQTGGYMTAFNEEHPKRFDEATVQQWRDVLQEIGKLDGWHIKEGMHEGKLVTEIVKKVSSTLNKSLSHDSDKLVAIESHIRELLKLLDIKSDVTKIVGIHGLGGIGKTTIAWAAYNRILNKFEGHAFIRNVREDARKFGIQHLQNKLMRSTLKNESPNIDDVETGIKVIQERLSTKRVLFVLDDVDQDVQTEFLIGDGNWLHSGSRIIITSRDKDILIKNKAMLYEPNLMNLDDSLVLFSRYAFQMDQPQEDYMDLSKAIVKITEGLPLALRVIGSSLFSKKKSIWEDMLMKLQMAPSHDVMESLKISYDGLGHAEQQMFLDIACFFIGMKKDFVCYVWEDCNFFPQLELEVLCANSLITINENDELGMHDVLRDLGREIVRRESTRPGKRSRIWCKEEALDVLDRKQGTNKCVGFRLVEERLKSEGLDAMTELRLLQLDYTKIIGNCHNSFSELRWLSWKACKSKPSLKVRQLSWKGRHGLFSLTKFCPKKLVVLDFSESKMTEKWMGWNYIKLAVNLKVLNLENCWWLRCTPDFSGNPLLEVLNLRECSDLKRAHKSIGYLRNLVTLSMRDCVSLVNLPIKACELASLKTLDLCACESLRKLPENLDRITSLTTLHICDSRDTSPVLPPSLTSVGFHKCESLLEIPNLPPSLVSLDVSHCYSLEEITLRSLSSLTSLSIEACYALGNISGLPSSLRSLKIDDCESLLKLSSSSGGLRNLKTLDLADLYSLKEIDCADDHLESLELFRIRECKSLKRLPKLRLSKNLVSLTICEIDVLSDFEGEGMDSLEELKIKQCESLKRIPYLRDSKRLRELQIDQCEELIEIESLESYESLEILFISGVPSLKVLPLGDISALNNLRDLTVSYCEKLQEIQGLHRLECLQELSIEYCENLGGVPDLSNLKKLWRLRISGLDNSSKILGLDGLKSLEVLEITDCDIIEIHGFERLERLRNLSIEECLFLGTLPDLSNLQCLKEVRIKGCNNLPDSQHPQTCTIC